jgi:hypothetical protein
LQRAVDVAEAFIDIGQPGHVLVGKSGQNIACRLDQEQAVLQSLALAYFEHAPCFGLATVAFEVGQILVFGPAFPLSYAMDQQIEPVEIGIVIHQGLDLLIVCGHQVGSTMKLHRHCIVTIAAARNV